MTSYQAQDIKTLDWREHIRLRPGMYIGKLGDGSLAEDGIYILLKEVIDNAIDEHTMGFGKRIDLNLTDNWVHVRDYGRGIPLSKLEDCAAKINTGAKYDSNTFKKSVGLNGVGIKAVNALSADFIIQAWRDGKTRTIHFQRGTISQDKTTVDKEKQNGTAVSFQVDSSIFPSQVAYREDIITKMCTYYTFLNAKLTIYFNKHKIKSKNGLVDLLHYEEKRPFLYEPIILQDNDLNIVFTHVADSRDNYYTFVNSQYTQHGGTHLNAFKENVARFFKEHFSGQYDSSDFRAGMVAIISIRIENPIFESQTKTKLGSTLMTPKGQGVKTFIKHFLSENLSNFLAKNKNTSSILEEIFKNNKKTRLAVHDIKKLAQEKAKTTRIHNKKLRDCKVKYYSKHARRKESTLFITEGDSASGSITKSRDVATQAVFSLRGKPLNSYNLDPKIVYENEEFYLLQNALNLEKGIDSLAYRNIVIATDADVDGMHIRLLLLTFFLQFFPELITQQHIYILQTPLFRVQSTKKTYYCYSEKEKEKAIKKCSTKVEITRFKGLGEISPHEFKMMIGADMRLELVQPTTIDNINKMLGFYMGKNTLERQQFIMQNLREGVS